MRNLNLKLGLLPVLLSALWPNAASANDHRLLTTIGKWNVWAYTDAMNDERYCVAFYNDDVDIQIHIDGLTIDVTHKGGLVGYQYRLDDQAPRPSGLLTDRQMNGGHVIFDEQKFQEIKAAHRLRLRIMTMVSGDLDEDIDLADLPKVIETFQSAACKSVKP